MLISFKCANYYSFNNEVAFSTEASESIISEDNNRYHLFENKKYNKVSSLYGKNGSGKTTFISALEFLKNMVIHSSKDSQEGEEIDVRAFAFSEDRDKEPSFFEVSFLHNEAIYRYGVKTTEFEIIEEYLYGYLKTENNNISKRETLLFERNVEGIDLGRKFTGINKFLNSPDIQLRKNALLLSYSAQMGHTSAREIVEWFNKLRISYEGIITADFTASILQNENDELYHDVLNFLRKSDLGISNIIARETESSIDDYCNNLPSELKEAFIKMRGENKKVKEFNIKTQHLYVNDDGQESFKFLDLSDESSGINKMFSLAGPIIDCLHNGYIFIIDEIETNLHYLLTKKIVEMFNSDLNCNGSQLIFSTHSPLLMDLKIIDRDQMWIMSLKNSASQINRLSDKYRVRKDTNVVQKIIDGEYDSAPIID